MTIKLGVYDIAIQHHGNISTIEYSPVLMKFCPHCNQSSCCYSCEGSVSSFPKTEYKEHGGEIGGSKEVTTRLQYNGAIDGIMALILAHCQAGIDVTTPAYLEGIKMAVEEFGNNT